MPVIDSEQWKKIREYITAYVDRGGENEGKNFKLLQGTNLLNEVGVAMGLSVSDFSTWSSYEWKEAAEGNLCFFKGESRKTIDGIVDVILSEFDDKSVYLTIIPYALVSSDNKLYFLCLFKAKKFQNSSVKYFDNAGRVYSSFEDWKNNNVLPPGTKAYPLNGVLERGSNGGVDLRYKDTPSSSTVAKVADITAGVVGIVGSVGAILASGGLAIPFVVGGVASAVYGTTRSVYHLVDRGTHGQSVNPFTDHTAFTLWLGIGANILCFGAMGATMRFTSLVVKGKTISDGFRIVVNIINGSSFVCNTVAMANGLIYTLIHLEELSPVDLLMQVASMAFWARSMYTFQTAGTIAKNIRAEAIQGYTNGLSGDQRDAFEAVRLQIQNDETLVKLFYNGAKNKFDPTQIGIVLSDLNQASGGFSINPQALSISVNGNTFDLKLLMSFSSNDRQVIMQVVGNLNTDQASIFNQMRGLANNDFDMFRLISYVGQRFDITPEAATQGLIKFFSYLENNPIRFSSNNEGVLNFSNGQQFTLQQIVTYSGDHDVMNVLVQEVLPLPRQDSVHFNQIRFAALDDGNFFNWIEVAFKKGNEIVKNLVLLEANPVLTFKFSSLITAFVKSDGISCDIVSLRNHVNLSVKFLVHMNAAERNEMLIMVKNSQVVNGILSKDFVGKKFGIQSEITRNQAKVWYLEHTAPHRELTLTFPSLKPHNLNRLHYLKTQLSSFKLETTKLALTNVVFAMKPSNVTDLISYHDFGKAWMDKYRTKCTPAEYSGYVKAAKAGGQKPTNKATWSESQAKDQLTPAKLREHFEKYKQVVIENEMFNASMLDVPKELPGENLILAIQEKVTSGKLVKFASEVSAVTHLFKHENGDLSGPMSQTKNYVKIANEIICDPSAAGKVSWTQEGSSRLIEFSVPGQGKVILLETSEGKVLLSTYIEGSRVRTAAGG